jgi:hypothetical protein
MGFENQHESGREGSNEAQVEQGLHAALESNKNYHKSLMERGASPEEIVTLIEKRLEIYEQAAEALH